MDVAGFVILALVLPIFAPPTSLAAPTSAVVGGLETTLVGDRLPSSGQSSPSASSSTLWTSTAVSTVSPSPRASDGVRSCLVDGAIWQHGQQVVRSDQCEFCLCFDGELFCWWQDCPPTTARGPCQGSEAFTPCNSFSDNGLPTNETDDEVTSAATVPSSSTTTTSTISTVSEVSTSTSSAGAAENAEVSTEPPVLCKILGTVYRVGDVLPRDTGSCLQCECGSYGRIVCGPKDCLPIRDTETGTGPDSGNTLDMFDVDTF